MEDEPHWSIIQKKLGTIPTYFKYLLSCCGYENPTAVATICEEDFSYFEEEVRSGAVSKYLKTKSNNSDVNIFQNTTKAEEGFEFSRGHKKLLLAIANFVKLNLETHGTDFFTLVKPPKPNESQEYEIMSKATVSSLQTVSQYNTKADPVKHTGQNAEIVMNRIEFFSQVDTPQPTQPKIFSEAMASNLQLCSPSISKPSFQSNSQCNLETCTMSLKLTSPSSSENPSQILPKLVSISIKLIKIDCTESATKNYHDEKGYLYSNSNSKATKNMYFRCKNNTLYSCPARGIAKGNYLEKAILKVEHNHTPEKKIFDRTIFSKTLDKVIIENPLLPRRKAFFKAKKEVKKKQVDRVHIRALKSYENFIHNRQKREIPLLANSIAAFETLINSEKYKKKYWFDERDLIFFRGVWKDKNGNSSIVFMSETSLQVIAGLKNVILLMDGTFKVLCYHLKFCQLYIISFIFKGRCYPLAFILMERRDFVAYDNIFTNIKSLIPSLNVGTCMTDYELATRKALRLHFPDARIAACFFHYVQAIIKACKRFGLLKDTDFDQTIQQVCALALLPNEFISDGFQVIDKNAKKSTRWDRFKNYWLGQWASANISVYGLANRSNNFAETLNKMLSSLIEHAHPNIWILIANLKDIEMDRSDELERNDEGDMIETRRSGEIARLNKKIKRATQIFDEDQDVEAFLKHVTFNDKIEHFFKERIYLVGVDEKYEFDDGDIEEDLIIPNDYNEQSNFRRNHPRSATTSKRNTDTRSNERIHAKVLKQ